MNSEKHTLIFWIILQTLPTQLFAFLLNLQIMVLLFELENPARPRCRINQRAKKVVSDSPGLVDFAIGLVNFELNLPDLQVKFFEEFKLKKNCEINSAHKKTFLGLVEMTFGLVYASFSLPEWQTLKITFFAP